MMYSRWLNDPSTLEQYAGKQVAIHATKGVIASGLTISDIFDKTRNYPEVGELLFYKFPSI